MVVPVLFLASYITESCYSKKCLFVATLSVLYLVEERVFSTGEQGEMLLLGSSKRGGGGECKATEPSAHDCTVEVQYDIWDRTV